MAVAERLLDLRPDTDTRPDRALVNEAQHGREDAATTLIQRYYPRIYSFVSHLTYGRTNAEDLTQEVFARALKGLGRFNGQYQFEHWLFRIAKNLCIDEARRNVHLAEPTDPVDLPELEGIPAPDYVWESVSRDLVASVVQRALTSLPPRQRAILVMREMEGMSYADIAQVVGTNPRGVEATLRRARIRFRIEVSRAESAEEATAACRRVLRLVSDNPAASRSEEAASHLAHCADCRRRTRVASVGPARLRAFGFIPLFGLQRLFGAVRHPGASHWVRRASDRARDGLAVAGLGSSVAAVPFARMAEVAGGVLVATVVTVAPALSTTTIQPASTAVASVTEVPYQVASVPSTATLYRASAAAPVSAATAASAVAPAGTGVTTPSIVSSPAVGPLGVQDLLSQLGLAPGQDALATAIGNVGSISNILADQLSQVAQLADKTLSQVTTPLGQPVQSLTQPVSELADGTVLGVSGTLHGLGSTLGSASKSH